MTKKREGRPTKHKPEYNEMARKLCLLGFTNAELADFFNVSVSTIDNWMVKHPDFLGAVKAGRVVADMNVAASLYERAVGYSCTETKVFCVDGNIIEHDMIKHYPPEVGAAKYWLNNRQPKLWREKVMIEQDVTISTVPREQLDEIYNRNLEKQKEKMKEVIGRAERLGIVSLIDSVEIDSEETDLN